MGEVLFLGYSFRKGHAQEDMADLITAAIPAPAKEILEPFLPTIFTAATLIGAYYILVYVLAAIHSFYAFFLRPGQNLKK